VGSGVPGRRLAAALMLPVGHLGLKRLMSDFVYSLRTRRETDQRQGVEQ